ncbi:MAG: protein kinase [Bradymonadales bacterium]|nr:protein kinase [Bradymonadales bacterium]
MTIELKYDLGEELKSGPKGKVYKATHRALGRTCVIRILHPDLPREGEGGRLGLEAIYRHAELVHPNIGRILDADLACPEPYLVMDYYPNGTLGDRLDSGRKQPARIMADLLLMLNALAFAHSKGVLHRDMSPGNVLYDELDIPHLVDFSFDLLKPTDPGGKRPLFVGVRELAYRSPELFRDPQAHTEQTDMYGLGVMLYEALSGDLPGREAPVLSEVSAVPFEVDELYVRLTGRFDPFQSSAQALWWALSTPEIVNSIAVSSVLGPLFKELPQRRQMRPRQAGRPGEGGLLPPEKEKSVDQQGVEPAALSWVSVEVEPELLEGSAVPAQSEVPWELNEPIPTDDDVMVTADLPLVDEKPPKWETVLPEVEPIQAEEQETLEGEGILPEVEPIQAEEQETLEGEGILPEVEPIWAEEQVTPEPETALPEIEPIWTEERETLEPETALPEIEPIQAEQAGGEELPFEEGAAPPSEAPPIATAGPEPVAAEQKPAASKTRQDVLARLAKLKNKFD